MPHTAFNRQLALITQERGEILAERNFYRKELSEALSDLKELLDLKQRYNELYSELADVKRELARERLRSPAVTAQEKGDGGRGTISARGQNVDTYSLPENSQSSANTISISATPGPSIGVRTKRAHNVKFDMTEERTFFGQKIPAVEDEDVYSICSGRSDISSLDSQSTVTTSGSSLSQSPPGSMNASAPARPPVPTSSAPSTIPQMPGAPAILTQDCVVLFTENSLSESSVAKQAKNVLDSDVSKGPYISAEAVKKLVDLVNQSEAETDAKAMKDVLSAMYGTITRENVYIQRYTSLCQSVIGKVSSKVLDWGKRDTAGNPSRGGQLFRSLLLNRCQTDFEQCFSYFSCNRQTPAAALLDWDQEDVSKERARQTERALRLVEFIGFLLEQRILAERVVLDCVEKLVTLSEAEDSDRICIECLYTLLQTAGKFLPVGYTRGRMDMYFDRIRELAWPRSASTKNVGLEMQGILRELVDLRERNWK